VLKAARKAGDLSCGDKSYSALYRPVTNNYVAYLLQKRSSAPKLGGDDGKQDKQESRRLCDLLGLAHCPAAE